MPDLQTLEQRFNEVLQATIEQWPIDPDEREEVSHRVTGLGGTQVVKSTIHDPDDSDQFLSLQASDRPDLTLEALALCPAWNNLFSEEDKAAARARLTEARTKWGDRPERRAKTCDETWVFWIDGRPVGVSHHGVEDSESPAPTCEMFARAAETFAESGQLGASFNQRRHYRTCAACSALHTLDEIVTLLDQEEFHRLEVLLSIAPELLSRPGGPGAGGLWLWVLLSFIDLKFDVKPEDWVAARQGLADEAFSAFVQSLHPVEFFGFPLAKRTGGVFEVAIAADKVLSLPSELGLPSEPGVVNTLIPGDEWNRLRETADENLWGLKPGTGVFEDDRFNWFHFVQLVVEATEFQINVLWNGPSAEHPPTPDFQPISPESRKVPRDNQAPRDLAVASLRQTIGIEICNNLCADAFLEAVEAEHLYHDPGLRLGQGLIFHLVNAFELQLARVVIEPFTESLKVAGARNFPEPIRKPLAWRLMLGDIGKLIQYPAPELAAFFKAKRLNLSAMADAFPEILAVRNKAFHLRPYTPDQGRELRDRWLGIERGDGGIFSLLRPRAT